MEGLRDDEILEQMKPGTTVETCDEQILNVIPHLWDSTERVSAFHFIKCCQNYQHTVFLKKKTNGLKRHLKNNVPVLYLYHEVILIPWWWLSWGSWNILVAHKTILLVSSSDWSLDLLLQYLLNSIEISANTVQGSSASGSRKYDAG